MKDKLLTSGSQIKSNESILNKKLKDDAEKSTNRRILEETKAKYEIKERGIDIEEQKHEKVLQDMVNEEQPKIQIPVEDTENLIRVIETQRNTALTAVAVEKARVKTLLSIIEKQKQDIQTLKELMQKNVEYIDNE